MIASSRPSPADVAARIADRNLAAPGALGPDDLPFRLLYERGILRSGMHRHTRLVALALASHADYVTGTIADRDQPFLIRLADETRLLRPQVVVALNTLLQRGWVKRAVRAPGLRLDYETSVLILTIPGLLLDGLREA
ncbi:hypothetical protein [Streptomyces sp. SID3212]|uniref:hypothetical protein n=1 Tax=Streptomyces sp. SID3212 TaxID=2690259 RepID=UPI00136D1FDD|nr:hypothetical protein [Streptomyces sp. SID3212]MYV56476.1 hypothetical protein [Streptomyces sp. SID3212]